MKRVVLLSFMVVTFAACKKNELPIIQNEKRSEQQSAKIEFAQTFARFQIPNNNKLLFRQLYYL